MRNLLKLLPLLFTVLLTAQQNQKIYKVTYDSYANGKKKDRQVQFDYHRGIVYNSKDSDKIKQYTDVNTQQNISTITYKNQLYKSVIDFKDLPKPTFAEKPATILGYDCKYASFFYFSNTIEVWYTEKTEAKGSPYSRYLPAADALVLRVLINGNRELKASAIQIITPVKAPEFNVENAIAVDKAAFEELKINSRYHKLVIFDNEQINFDPSIPVIKDAELALNKTYHFANGTVLMKKIKLTDNLKNSKVFAKLYSRSNGDAYDRTGSVFIIPGSQKASILNGFQHGLDKLPVYTDSKNNNYQGVLNDGNYAPSIELMRFFTAFGTHHFNDKREIKNYDWAENVMYNQEVTKLIPSDEEEIWVGVFIGNYNKGGHKVSLELDFYPSMSTYKKPVNKYINSLFSTVNRMEASGQNYGRLFKNDTLKIHFEIKENINDLQLIYTTTGHGGWDDGDEYMPRMNRVLVDGKQVFAIVPWRSDCATYRLSNPASGNFGNGLSSSDYSRSNWCPGTLTTPYYIPLHQLKKGKHTMEIIVEQGNDGGTSFSHWGVTGVLTGSIAE
ncbi:MAG: peptide-N-glycosidase [Flavobacteriaceae bacterium]|nr:MAG: peptide-N-glycosidase [Flavobacteriaceae bacterium]